MARTGKLKAALKDYKKEDPKKAEQTRLRKEAERKKRKRSSVQTDEPVDIAHIDDTDSSEDEDEDEDGDDGDESVVGAVQDELNPDGQVSRGVQLQPEANGHGNGIGLNDREDEGDEDEDEDEDIPYSDIASLDSEDRGDVVSYQRLTINNHAALTTSLKRIAIPISSLSFSTHQTITASEATVIKDIDDDLSRELAFYAQALAAVKRARKQLKHEGVPFSRPTDYFAEMVKSEEHMGRVRQRLVDDAAGKKAAADARRQRDLKKFGKAVQVAKLQERDKAKRETIEKINTLKRKRSNALPTAETEEDLFDVALDEETKRPRTSASGGARGQGGLNHKRQSKDQKYGFGGKKRHGKSGDAQSTSDMRDFSAKKMKTQFSSGAGQKKQRPGKARRKARS